MPIVLPDWCELVRGDGPILLIAPHGGRRPPVDLTAPPANLKVNDVHTAALTRELAGRLGATAVINHGCDRNTLDLNRISQVRRQAPWFLALLRDEIGAILSRYECAEILFVHGWNVGQAKCDIGIGMSETTAGVIKPDGAGLTVTASYLNDRIAGLRAALEQGQIATFLGVRYPASHPNNLLQVFTDRAFDERHSPVERQFAKWAAAGRLQAIQLELGVPLRWPGVWRERLLDCLTVQFGAKAKARLVANRASTISPRADYDAIQKAQSARPEPVEGRATHTSRASGRRAAALQFYDPVADVGLLAGVGPIGKETTAARLLLFLGGQRVALFTGERTPACALVVEPLHFASDDESTTLRFHGPILHLDDGATYLDLEAAFVASTLDDVEVELRFRGRGADPSGAEFGRVEGWIDRGGQRRTISTGGYANAAAPRSGPHLGYAMLAADFGDGRGLLAKVASGGASSVVEFGGDGARDRGGASMQLSPASPLELPLADGSVVRAASISHMEILRSLAGGRYARVTFGTARFQWGQRQGHGVYEYAALAQP